MPRMFPSKAVRPWFLLAALVGLLLPTPAGAARYRIDSRTSTLLYPIVGRDGVVVADQSILQTRLRLRVDDLLALEDDGVEPLLQPDIAADVSLRLFGNFGLAAGTTDPASPAFIPQSDSFRPDILFAFVEATNLADGWIDALRAGRIIHSTVLGWRSDDGALVRVGYEDYVHLQLVGGLENTPGLDRLSASPFAPDGVERWSADGAGADRYERRGADGGLLTPQDPQYRPTFQATADGQAGPIGYELGYRHTWLAAGEGAAEQLAGIRLDGDIDPVTLLGMMRVDAGAAVVSDATAEADLRLGNGRHHIAVLYDYFRPTFDLDSIFWVFATDPFHEITLRYSFPLIGALSGTAWTTMRRVEDVEGAGDSEPVADPFTDIGGGIGLTLRRPTWSLAAKWKIMRGAATNLAAFDLTGRARLFTWWELYGIGSVWQYEDRARDRYHGVGGAGRLGSKFEILPGIVGVDGEFQVAHDPREGTTFAGFVWLDLGVTL
jgi:hypothetical protein